VGEAQTVVSFGETILCVGQSNMGMQVGPSERAFDADNATAENAASVLYTGKIFLHSRVTRWSPAKGVNSNSTTWYSVTPDSIQTFSAVCWLTGRDLFNHLGGAIPVGLAMNAVGAHAIESWLSPEALKACGVTTPCTTKEPASKIWAKSIKPMMPFTFGSMIYDQGEQDLNCQPAARTDTYACMEAQLIDSYRSQFNSSFPFIAVQLPGYTGGVFPMRLAQETGTTLTSNAAVLPTYDLSCAMGKADGCPHGNVHNVHKQPVAARLALMLQKMKLGENVTVEGPRITHLKVSKQEPGAFTVKMSFDRSGLTLKGTRNCTTCCQDAVSDFDVSDDGLTWYNGTAAQVSDVGKSVQVSVSMSIAPTVVRYTANRIFPQCAVYSREGLPAYPFQRSIAEQSGSPWGQVLV